MKLNKLLSICLGITLAFSVSANDLSEARIYINPGHGGWGPNDRPMATINYAQMDTLGFFETNTNLIKGMALREELVKAGAGYVRMSRTVNGVVAADDEHKTENDKYIETQPGESGTQQLVTLSVICQDVEANNMDYFISIHSNAATEGSSTNYPLILYRGTDSESPAIWLVPHGHMSTRMRLPINPIIPAKTTTTAGATYLSMVARPQTAWDIPVISVF